MNGLNVLSGANGTFLLDGSSIKIVDFYALEVLEDSVISQLCLTSDTTTNLYSSYTNNVSKTLKAGTTICVDRSVGSFGKIVLTSGCVNLILA